MSIDAAAGSHSPPPAIARSLTEIGLYFQTDKVTHHKYDPFYVRHLESWRNRPFTMLEIGVYQGASLRTWHEYFPKAQIIGVDIDPECKQHEQDRVRVFIGDQGDQEFMKLVAMSAIIFDLVIDDGSHKFSDQQASKTVLWPYLRPGGFYVIEDLQTAMMPYYSPAPEQSMAHALATTTFDILNGRNPYPLYHVHAYPRIAFLEKA